MRLCVIGDPVGHSLSPRIHRRFMERCGAAGSYEAMTVTAETLEDFVAQGRRGAWDGCNVTMPLKERILPLLDAVEPWTASCGAVNTVCFRDGRAVGYNTDGPGVVESLRLRGFAPSGQTALVLGAGSIGISQMTALNLALFITAAWWLVTTLPLLRQYKQVHFVEVQEHAIRQSFARIGHTLRHLKEDRQVFWFLLAFFCYIDGVYTIIDMATAYGTALGLDTTGLLLALLVTQIVAFPSALVFGRLSGQYPSGTLIPVCIAAYAGIALFAFFLKHQWQFWVLAVVVGMFQGGIQALSRSHFAKIIPPEKSGEYFGLFDICGKGASFLGTMIVSVGSQLTGSANVGVGSLIVLFIVGFVLFRVSDRK